MQEYDEVDDPLDEVMKFVIARDKVYKAFQTIIDNRDQKALMWAVNYARYGLTITDKGEIHTQCLYVLNNIQRWRGDTAKQVRNTLKDFCGIKRKGAESEVI